MVYHPQTLDYVAGFHQGQLGSAFKIFFFYCLGASVRQAILNVKFESLFIRSKRNYTSYSAHSS